MIRPRRYKKDMEMLKEAGLKEEHDFLIKRYDDPAFQEQIVEFNKKVLKLGISCGQIVTLDFLKKMDQR